jgi:predicted DNA-binding transcriptional regulator AlpA
MTEKTEQEKIAICILFLEKRGYVVGSPRMSRTQVAAYLGFSAATVARWTRVGDRNYKKDFPLPLATKTGNKSEMYLSTEIKAWADRHCEPL